VIELEQPARFGKETTLVEMPIHWATDDAPHFEFVRTETVTRPGLMNANLVGENWINDFLYLCDTMEWGVLTYTCHPFVIGRGARMMMLEKVIRTAADKGAEFMTMEDAVAEFKKREKRDP
jgi:peptidoglycan/xylan/chitin deacetylase (PgdA/CDA1 family)